MPWLGFAFVVGGFVAIGLGWNGMARRATFDEQVPYVLSGGIAGIGLIVLGIWLLLVAQIRSERQRLSTILDVMGPAAKKLAPKAEASPQPSEPFLFQVRHGRMLSLGELRAGRPGGGGALDAPPARLPSGAGQARVDRLTLEVAQTSGL
jgi:hypothetical protein